LADGGVLAFFLFFCADGRLGRHGSELGMYPNWLVLRWKGEWMGVDGDWLADRVVLMVTRRSST
jgi:hypothetical protein